MTKELRQIMFGPSEIIAAITEYHRRRSFSMPRGKALRCYIADEPVLSATLFIEADNAGIIEMSIDAENLGAALILYCITRKIPLPAESDKRLRKLTDETAALFLVKPPQ